jgi:hypothetical protein
MAHNRSLPKQTWWSVALQGTTRLKAHLAVDIFPPYGLFDDRHAPLIFVLIPTQKRLKNSSVCFARALTESDTHLAKDQCPSL